MEKKENCPSFPVAGDQQQEEAGFLSDDYPEVDFALYLIFQTSGLPITHPVKELKGSNDRVISPPLISVSGPPPKLG